MEKLLDKEVHQMYKAPASSMYYSSAASSQQNGNSVPADDKAVNDEIVTKDSDETELHEETENGNTVSENQRDSDQPSTVRPRSLPSAQNSAAGSTHIRDLRQSHRTSEDNGEHSEGASSPG
ncbi:hypothetical protein X975_06073, partial [Stegodyphus mimosarum]